VQGVAAVSEDGSHIYFIAQAKLTGPNVEGAEPQEEGENLYVYTGHPRTGEQDLAFIATLASSDSGQWEADAAEPMNVTPDGRVLVFESSADLTSEGESTGPQVYRYATHLTPSEEASEAITHKRLRGLARVSIGTEAVGAHIPHQRFAKAELTDDSAHPAVSSSGEVIVFSSAAVLAPAFQGAAPSNVKYVYEYEGGEISLISDPSVTSRVERSAFGSLLVGISPSGADIYFETSGPLVPQDGDTLVDLYDARVDGGFPARESSTTCRIECEGVTPSAPILPANASAAQGGGDNLPFLPQASRPKPLTRKQMLQRALKKCSHRSRRQRHSCEVRARLRYGHHAVEKRRKRLK
jgi:hypothetical protein